MSDNMQQKDFVLSPNEFAYILDKTKGIVSVAVGPFKTSPSNTDALVIFNEKTKRFEETSAQNAIQTFITAPENWYIVLKNPVINNKHPKIANSNNAPEDMQIGEKINVTGPTSFALYPGQMAKVVQGHRLRSNQYLLARVYNADVNGEKGKAVNKEGEEVEINVTDAANYTVGQLLIIKGTDVSFYIPPTGIEVIAVGEDKRTYIRDAVTLERLEYCILKDEDGNKRYVHGPAVVFPEPTEMFVKTSSGDYKRKAIELSKISGIYIKVIADYTDDNGIDHKVGEEMFITGDQQMIYYPRPEHAIIDYGGQFMHYAIAIPRGEGRYVMDRLTGQISIVHGPAMFLPDPRTQVIVKRKLTRRECEMIYPGNKEVLNYNLGTEFDGAMTAMAKGGTGRVDHSQITTMASDVAADMFNRKTEYTKPRTLTLDTKFEGIVSSDIWTGYAVNIVGRDGSRRVVTGPATVYLEYDETYEVLQLSSGKPKTTDKLVETAFLRYENNKVSDIINVLTKDFVNASVKVSYVVNFDIEQKDKWFNVENYVKFLCDRVRSLVKRYAREHTIEDFYQNYATIIREILFAKGEKFVFPENGMSIDDVDILAISVEEDVANLIEANQSSIIKKNLELTNATKSYEVTAQLEEMRAKELALKQQNKLYELELKEIADKKAAELALAAIERKREEEAQNSAAALERSKFKDMLHEADLAREKQEQEFADAVAAAKLARDEKRQQAYATTIKNIFESVSPDLVAAMTSRSNDDMLKAVTGAMAPLAIAQGESIPDTVNKLLRGTSLENMVNGININASVHDDE